MRWKVVWGAGVVMPPVCRATILWGAGVVMPPVCRATILLASDAMVTQTALDTTAD